MKKTIRKKEVSRKKIKIMGRNQRKVEHGKDKADISADLVKTEVTTVEFQVKPRSPKSKKTKKTQKKSNKPQKRKKRSKK